MNKKIIFGILASFSLFSCFAADTQSLKSILKKPFYLTEEQAGFVVQVGKISQNDGIQQLVKDSLVTLLSNYDCNRIAIARISRIKVTIPKTNSIFPSAGSAFSIISNAPNALDATKILEDEFKKVVGDDVECGPVVTLGVSQIDRLSIKDLDEFKEVWIPLLPEKINLLMLPQAGDF